MINAFCVTRVLKLDFLQLMYGSLMILPPSCVVFLKANIFSKTEREKLQSCLISKFEKLFRF